MRYYKLIKNNDTFIGVITENDFRKYQKKHNIFLVCDSKSAQFVRFNNILYRDRAWMQPIDENIPCTYEEIDVINIEETDYNTILSAMEKEIEIIETEAEITVEEEDVIEEYIEEDVTIDYVKDVKILEMSKVCKKVITEGFDIILNDGNNYHFSLTIEDQINLLNISNMMTTDEKIIYHADGERCRYFSKEDMSMIINKANNFKTYHTTYFNCLKAYITTLRDFETIESITYGIDLPDKFNHVFLTNYKNI